ncbi:hypothetical protein DV711_07260 [Motiliproteus coralliicola]|uniref:Uncharacterized protein n=1 Tax=Motiliproteus coralliicola TaxID=2283196 RepID=A0A369WP99_9GAMM|nr:hypothetical protein [Motiliproteus coralliicola]RDE22396.1 hypothetical protein DV711_07260 [Motiliproteus coralliicola]
MTSTQIDLNGLISEVDQALRLGQELIEALETVKTEDELLPVLERRQQQLMSLPLERLQGVVLPSALTDKLSKLWQQDGQITDLAIQQRRAVSQAIKTFRKGQSGVKTYQNISQQSR